MTPLEKDDLLINNFYLHVAVTPDAYDISIHEFAPLGLPQVSRHPYMPGLEGFAAQDPESGKLKFLHVEPLGLVPDMRENFHRVFRATDEARSVLEHIAHHNDLAGYFSLIRETFSQKEVMLISENEICGKAAFSGNVRKPSAGHTMRTNKDDGKIPPQK